MHTLSRQATEEKLEKLDFINIKKLLYIKGRHQESEKKTHSVRDNICKSHI